jgi:hypothetical protein
MSVQGVLAYHHQIEDKILLGVPGSAMTNLMTTTGSPLGFERFGGRPGARDTHTHTLVEPLVTPHNNFIIVGNLGFAMSMPRILDERELYW